MTGEVAPWWGQRTHWAPPAEDATALEGHLVCPACGTTGEPGAAMWRLHDRGVRNEPNEGACAEQVAAARALHTAADGLRRATVEQLYRRAGWQEGLVRHQRIVRRQADKAAGLRVDVQRTLLDHVNADITRAALAADDAAVEHEPADLLELLAATS